MSQRLLQPSLTAGEMAPALYGRVDITRYQAGLRRCRNFIIRPYGGADNRAGLQFCARTPGNGDHRLIPFIVSPEISYTLFFGDGFIRFQFHGEDVAPKAPAYAGGDTYALDAYVTSGGIVYRSLEAANIGHTPVTSPSYWIADAGLQITSPYTADQVDAIRFTQSVDVMYLAHPEVPPRTLSRLTTNSFVLALYENVEGPFTDLNTDEATKVAASAVQGTVTLESTKDIFTTNAVGSLFYLEPKNLGQLRPWVVGEREIVVGDLRVSDGKTYRATTVPTAGTWHETGPRQPIHENGRVWDGGGKTRTNGVDTWSVGIEWEFVDSGYGIIKITAYTDANTVTGTVTKRLPPGVVGGVGSPAHTWNLTGDGSTKTFAIAAAGYGIFAVTIDGVGVQSDPNYVPPDSATGSGQTSGGGTTPFEDLP